jgi:uncharacterized protein (DUF2267 family)
MALEEIKMSSTDIFARSFQKTDIWLKQAARELKWRDRRKTYIALRAVLHALRDRVTNREAVQLGAQLPTVTSNSRGNAESMCSWRRRRSPLRSLQKPEASAHS